MANLLKFKKGTLANLSSAAIENGSILVTTDEHAMYVDVDGARIRLGDFREYANVAAIEALPVENRITTALYYAVEENVLAKWNGSKWVQINSLKDVKDRLTAVEKKASDNADAITGLGDRVKTVEDDLNTENTGLKARMTAVEGRATAVEGRATSLESKVGSAKDGETPATGLFASVDKNAADIGTNKTNIAQNKSDISAVAGRVTTAEGAIDALEEALDAADTGVKARLTSAEGRLDIVENDLNAASTGLKAEVSALKTLTGTHTTGIAANAAAISDNATAIAANKTAIEDNDADIAAINEEIGTVAYTGDSLTAAIAGLQQAVGSDASGLGSKVAALEETVGDASKGLVKSVSENTNAITTLSENKLDASTFNTYKTDNDKAVAANKAAIESNDGELEALRTRATTIENAATALAGRVSTNEEAITSLNDNKVDKTTYATDKEALQKSITDSVNAVNAMTYIGAVANDTNVDDIVNAHVGDTYVASGNFTYNGQSVHAGDLLVAKGDEVDGVIADPDFDVVPTGYSSAHKATLTGADNKITLADPVSGALGAVSFEATGAAKVAVADNKVSISVEWEDFGPTA